MKPVSEHLETGSIIFLNWFQRTLELLPHNELYDMTSNQVHIFLNRFHHILKPVSYDFEPHIVTFSNWFNHSFKPVSHSGLYLKWCWTSFINSSISLTGFIALYAVFYDHLEYFSQRSETNFVLFSNWFDGILQPVSYFFEPDHQPRISFITGYVTVGNQFHDSSRTRTR